MRTGETDMEASVTSCEQHQVSSDEDSLRADDDGKYSPETKHLRQYAAEALDLVKLVMAKLKQAVLALLYLVWNILLHESHKYSLLQRRQQHGGCS